MYFVLCVKVPLLDYIKFVIKKEKKEKKRRI